MRLVQILICALVLAAMSSPILAAPRVVFVPGIMGSKLKVGGDSIWGEGVFDSPKLVYPGEMPAVAEALGVAEVKILGLTFEQTVYKKLYEVGASLATDSDLLPFNYDWRQSNRLSADQLAAFLCALEAEDGVVLIGHSMGGLVIKHWLLNHRTQACPDGHVPSVGTVAFLATPHFGSMSAFTSLVDATVIKPGWDWLVAGGLNRYGYTFDSIYELLPVATASEGKFGSSPRCSSTRFVDNVPLPNVSVRPVGADVTPVDLFDARTYEKLGIFKRFDLLGQTDDRFQYLQGKLDRAEAAICDLLKFEEPAGIKFHYIAGQQAGPPGTAHLLTFYESDPPPAADRSIAGASRSYDYSLDYSIGDGTVDRTAALAARNPFLDYDGVMTELVTSGHQEIVDELSVATLLSTVSGVTPNYLRHVQTASYTSPRAYSAFIQGLAGTLQASERADVVAAVSSNPIWAAYSPMDWYRVAQETNNPVPFEAVAKDAEVNPLYKAWAYQNSGAIYAKANLPTDAARALRAAIAASQGLPETDQIKIQPKAYSSLGWVFLEQGYGDEAEPLFKSALEIKPDSSLPALGLEYILIDRGNTL
ncbi:MAG: hypothetical protein JNL14_01805 [Devosia sp.]|uniref:lipase/acyltransferase domain-containing protein n=1 Tax=Devosia sp. TaxID=1871048 RepID=UPI001A5EBC10|nr:hypothetical protein [Devosia sp.]MBL8596452.1 hypothetical protein [Devosia sp.]